MASKTICANCTHQRLVDTRVPTRSDTVMIVDAGGTPFCFAIENRVDPVNGKSSMPPPPCEKVNTSGSCAWFSAMASDAVVRVGLLRVRGVEEWILPDLPTGVIIPGLLSAAEIAANLALEAANAPPPPPPPWESWESAKGKKG